MSRPDQAECRGLILHETANAIQVCKERGGDSWWIPRSQIGYLRRTKGDGLDHVVFTVPEWLVEEKQLWPLVP